jgi:PAS domain S-box-containing protein
MDLRTSVAKHKSAEEVLQERENIYKFLLDNSKEIVLVLSKRGKILFANKGLMNNYGYSEKEIIGKSIVNFLTKDSITKSLYSLAQEFLGHSQPEIEVKAKTKFGEIRYLKVATGSAPVYDKGKLSGVMVCASDITELRKAEGELKEREKHFRELWDHAPVAYHTLDINGIITDVNQTEAKMLGYAKEEMVGKSIFEFILPEQREEARRRFKQKISGQKIPRAESRMYAKKDGSKIYVSIDDVLERNGDSKVISVWTTMVDITEQKEMEAVVEESEKRYRDLVEKAGIAILIDDKEGNFKYVNKRYAEIFGYSVEEMKKQSIRSVVHPDDLERVMGYHKKRLQGKTVPTRYEFRGVRKDGSTIYLEVDSVALGEGENLTGTRSYLRDITERKLAEQALRESEERFRSVVEHSHEGIFIVDDAYRFVYCNDELSRILGCPREEIIDQDFRKFLDDESKELVADRYVRRQRGEKIPARYEFNVIGKNGDKRRVEISSVVIKDSRGKTRTVAQILDITERKQAEEALRKNEEKYRTLTENVNLGIYRNTASPKGRFLEANPAIIGMFGYESKEEFLTLNVVDLYQNTEDRTIFNAKMMREGFVKDEELRLKKKNGTPLVASVSAVAVKDEEGVIKYYDGIIEDITERKRTEEQIKASLKEKETLLQEIHHRVKNNMQIISSLLNLQANLSKDNDFLIMVKASQSRIRSMALIHDNLYRSQNLSDINFSEYIQALTVHLFQFNQVNSNLVQLKMNLEDVFLDIQTAIPCGLILNELVTNSLKHAFPDGRSGEIMIELHPLAEHTFQIIVKDTGVGIPKDLDLSHTTSMGLQIVTSLLNQVEGSMEVQREGGTTVKIVFKESKYRSRL